MTEKRGPKDQCRGKGITYSLYCVLTGQNQLEQGYSPTTAGLVLMRTRTVPTFAAAIFILLMTVLVVVIGEKMNMVQVGHQRFGSRVNHLQAVSLFDYYALQHPNLDKAVLLSEDVKLGFKERKSDVGKNLRGGAADENEHQLPLSSESVESEEASGAGDEDFSNQNIFADGNSDSSETDDAKTPINAQSNDEVKQEFGWIEFPYVGVNETEEIMLQVRQNGTLPCYKVRTETAKVVGLPEQVVLENGSSIIQLRAGQVHELEIVSLGDDGLPRCAGGDYYETDLIGPRWKSRPPIVDNHNGTYSVRLQMDPRFAGPDVTYTFQITLLFANYHAMHYHPQGWTRMQHVATYHIQFTLPKPNHIAPTTSSSEAKSPDSEISSPAPPELELPRCELKDFSKKYWSGRWTRETETEDCEYARDGRWKCVDTELECQKPWCEGKVGRLESNGWAYSAHCAFKIFEKEEAWQCLDKKWLFFWGDSNHIDTIRNLLNFVLGFELRFLDRRMDTTFFSPPDNRSSVRITSMFNGHSNVSLNYEGLFSLHNADFAEQLRSYFTGETAPDIMIMNSGLHDGAYWRDVERFEKSGVEFAAEFWGDVWSKMRARRPDLVYRTTVATGGNARNMSFNPHKMELFNHLMLDKFMRMGLDRFHIVDGFDYTFPWHFDHKTNDGVHYGRPPARSKWAGGNIGHRYFVDLMLVHMLLNLICSPS